MIFSEVYGVYFQAVAEILERAIEKPVTEKAIREIVEREAFAESVLTIPAALNEGRWPLLDKEGRKLRIRFRMRKGKECRVICVPCKLEYSAKDDKFRLLGLVGGHRMTINMARILECRFLPECEKDVKLPTCEKREVELLLTDERNVLERAMLHFSHFEKVTERLDERHYHFLLRYDAEDETEVLIRILSFGPRLKVVAPEEFVGEIRARLEKQEKLPAVRLAAL